jgi:hypothetical protein
MIQQKIALSQVGLERKSERLLILQASLMARENRSRTTLPRLHEAGFCAFSQWDEDGILDWLIERLPGIPRSFVEFGVGDYRESNTRLLLQLRNWSGMVIDGSAAHILDIRSQELYWRHELTALQAFIDRDNINMLIASGGMSGEIGLLSVDIDGNDYWVWQAIDVVQPAIVVAEFNAVFGDRHDLTVPYRADFQRGRAHHSQLYFGASLPALVKLGCSKGYRFIGTGLFGCNAFFIREDLANKVLPALEGIWAFPTLAREARNEQGQLIFTSGLLRAATIAALPVVDLARGLEVALGELGELYSQEWAAGKGLRL